MKSFSILLFLSAMCCGSSVAVAKNKSLRLCWAKQVRALDNQFLTFRYQEKRNTLEHSFEPWEQTNWDCKGEIAVKHDCFQKNDTLIGDQTYFSKTQWLPQSLLFVDYGDKDLFAVTNAMFQRQVLENCRFSPISLIDYFYNQNIQQDKSSDKQFSIYKTEINQAIVTLYIQKSNHLLFKITTLTDNELFGDVLTTYNYSNFLSINQLFYPQNISIDKINGKLTDTINLSEATLQASVPIVLALPPDYKLNTDEATKAEIKVEKYSENIHFIELKHSDDKVMIVEFKDFMLVAEAPLNSKNGDLIIAEAHKIAPNKPIRYFVFGHHHPHYLGGLRPFVHAGAKVICSKADEPYVRYIAEAPHTLNPDALQKQAKALQTEEIVHEKTISDGTFEMKIYFIGNKSAHTNDYLVYYFPSEKLLFEDDLVWISRKGEIKKAGKRQAGLYNALKDLKLDIKTIIQSWPVADYGVKTVIPFEDLEKSMMLEQK